MLDPTVESFVEGALPPVPARVLEVGAGDGELAAALRSTGYEVLAIDPETAAAGVCPVALHEVLEPPASFDAAVGVVSLHHVDPLRDSCRRLAELVRPGGTLVLDEFDVERLTEPAAQWWLDHQVNGHARRTAAEVVAELRAHCHWLTTLHATLGEWFDLSAPRRGPYLYRWSLPPGLRSTEEDLIAAGDLPATGARIIGTRR